MIEAVKKVWDNSGKGWSEKQDYSWIVKWMTLELNHHNWKPLDITRDASECIYYASAEFMGYEEIHLLDNRVYYIMANNGHEDEDGYKVTVWFNTITEAIRYWENHIRIPIRFKNTAL